MAIIESWIDIAVSPSMAFALWTQFEQFPGFMAGLEEVTWVDQDHLHWRAKIAGKAREWDAVITEAIPNRRIAWRSTSGARNTGVVSFEPVAEGKTRMMLQLWYEPQGLSETVGDFFGVLRRRVGFDLGRFKQRAEEGDPNLGGIPPQDQLVGH